MSNDLTLDNEASNALVTEHLPLVQQVVNQLASRYPRHVDRSELWSAGAYGLVDASRRFDPDAGIPFARYAAIRIRGAIIDSTRTRDWATRRLRRDIRTVRETRDRFEVRAGRAPTEEELAGLLQIPVEELRSHRASAANVTLLHLDHPLPGAESRETGLGARLEERGRDRLPEEAVEHTELVGTVRSAVGFLPEPQQQVVHRYYFRGELLRDIADSLGVTEARASQIRSEALDAMRAYFGSAFDGVVPVAPNAPGIRRRATYVEDFTEQSTWRSRMDAALPDAESRAEVG